MGKTSWQVKQRYNDKAYDKIYVTVPKGKKDQIKAHAEAQGRTVNGFINKAIDEKITRDNQPVGAEGDDV